MASSSSTQTGKASTREELLSVLRGQSLRVPDLALMHAGWPKDMNPHVEAIDVKILQLIETLENIPGGTPIRILIYLSDMLSTKRYARV